MTENIECESQGEGMGKPNSISHLRADVTLVMLSLLLAKAGCLLAHMLGIAGNVAAEEPATRSLEKRKNVPKRQQKSGTAFCIPKLIFSDLMKNSSSSDVEEVLYLFDGSIFIKKLASRRRAFLLF